MSFGEPLRLSPANAFSSRLRTVSGSWRKELNSQRGPCRRISVYLLGCPKVVRLERPAAWRGVRYAAATSLFQIARWGERI